MPGSRSRARTSGRSLPRGTIWSRSAAEAPAAIGRPTADHGRVGDTGRAVAVRDSKEPEGGRLAFTRREWGAFAEQVKNGAYDLGWVCGSILEFR
ncbi:DUF397 domain-containing protein [Actinomadura sp. 9N407]|uniref:DUF397 domain-containing protein n=1 Tax=Actinomadura sp. 9N407 TaxID=3375154 RepID=UPI0037B2D445